MMDKNSIDTELRNLRETNRILQNVTRNMIDAIVITDVTGIIAYCSESVIQMGYRTSSLVGKNIFELVHLDDVAIARNAFDAMIRDGTRKQVEFRLFTESGDYHWYEVVGQLLKKETNSGTRQCIFSGRYIHDRKQAEEALQQSEQNYRYIFDNAIEGMFRTTLDGNVIHMNHSLQELLGFKTLDEAFAFINRPDSQIWLYPEKRDEYVALLKMKGAVHDHHAQYIRQDGSVIWVSIHARLIKLPESDELFIDGFVLDVNSRKIAENQLVAAKERAEESDRLKSAFLANMSHEIRTPMNGILGFAELLKEPDLSGDQYLNYIHIIEKSGHRMLSIINDIIDIAKIESGVMKVSKTTSNINEQIEYIYAFFKPEAEAKGLKMSLLNTLPAIDATIFTDKEKLYAILTNLVKNAIKFTEKGSIAIGYDKKGDWIEFFVSDTGIGIPEDRLEAIFERFIQADISDTMARQGAGLGLGITRAYVEMLGGKISVVSEEGVGSTFFFSLPAGKAPFQATSGTSGPDEIKAEKTPAEDLKLKIIVAEDDETSRQLITIAVKGVAGEIIQVKTGIEAIEVCRKNPDTDLILMDIRMPAMNGHDATRQIRMFNWEVIIIALTAYGMTGDRLKALDAGCNDYISKPINKDGLLAVIQKYFTAKPVETSVQVNNIGM
jgi:PAS domain S-box-containing protein